jgi:eukaryotic-like serine/threonine-protein kinase
MMTTSGQAGALIGGRYRLERPTGGGTWPEEIWQGFDETLNRPVMMRLLPIEGDAEPDLDEQVQSVVAQVARLGHPNIAQVYDVGHEGSLRYVVSEWTGGRTLGQIMATGPQSWQRTADWGQQIAEALGALHAIGLVDGVLGPETVSVMDDRRVKLTDVGLGVQEGAGRPGGPDNQATQLFPGGGAFGADPDATRLMGPDGADPDATRLMGPDGADDATRLVSPYGTDDPTRIVPGSSYGDDADATRLVSGGSRGAVPAAAASDVYALGAILWTALLGYPPEVGPSDTAGPDVGPLRTSGAPTDLALLLQSMLAASAPLRPSAAVAANRFAALGIEARETRSDPLPTAVLGAGAAGVGVGEATRAVGPLRMRDDDDDYVPPGGGSGSGSGRKAGIAIGVALLVVLAGVALALVLSHKNNNGTTPTGTSSVTAPTNSAGQISVSSAPSTSAAATTTSAAATTTSAAATTTSAAPTTTSASPSSSPTPSETTPTDTASSSTTDPSTGNASTPSASASTTAPAGGQNAVPNNNAGGDGH